jgi:acetyl-CoA synthetase
VTDLGWIMGPWEIVGSLALGATVLLTEGVPTFPGPDRLWATVERHRVDVLGVSPTLIRSLIPHGSDPVRTHDLSGLRILASTGEPWNPDAYRWLFEVVGGSRLPVINLSGGTEVGACFLSPTPLSSLKPCSLGGPALGMDVDIVDDGGDPVGPLEVGELICRQPWPSMTRGVWGDRERYLETYWSRFPGVWTHGDWASRDADGDWFLHGRSDDTLSVAGKRIGPAEVEAALSTNDVVLEAAVIGVPDEVKGEQVWCFVALRATAEPSDELAVVLEDAVVSGVGASFRPARVVFVPAIPKTRSGKLVRRVLRAVAMGDPSVDVSAIEDPATLAGVSRALDAPRPTPPPR